MGLDNGIELKFKDSKILEHPADLPMWLKPLELSWEKGTFELAYWRKCWNVRRDILNVLNINKDYENDGLFKLTVSDVEQIIEVLKSYNEENWDNSDGIVWASGSIWTFEEQKPHIEQQIKNLTNAIPLMKTGTCVVEFYDSY